MNWRVLNLSSASSVGTISSYIDQIDGFLLRCGYRDYRNGRIYADSKFNTFAGYLKNYTDRTKVGFYFETQAITTDEIDEEIAFIHEQIDDYEMNSFPIYIYVSQGSPTNEGRADTLTPGFRTELIQYYASQIERFGLMINYMYRNSLDIQVCGVLGSNIIIHTSQPTITGVTVNGWQYAANYDQIEVLKKCPPILFYTDEAGWLTGADIGTMITGLTTTEYDYTGKQIKASLYNPYRLQEGIDYTATYKNNVNVPTNPLEPPTVTLKGIHNYSGTVTYGFNINAIPLPNTATLNPNSAEYSGKNNKPTPKIQGIDSTNYDVEYPADTISVGTYQVTITGKRNYYGSIVRDFTITPARVTEDMFTIEEAYTYTGSQICPIVGYKTDKFDEITFTCTYGDNTNVGEDAGNIVVTGTGNFTGSVTLNFDIVLKVTKNNFRLSSYDWQYTAEEIKPKVYADYGLIEDVNYTVEYSHNTDIGTGLVYINCIYPIEGTFILKFTILPIDISIYQWSLEYDHYSFAGKPIEPAVIVKPAPRDNGVYDFGDLDEGTESKGDTDYDFNVFDDYILVQDFEYLATAFDPDDDDKMDHVPTYDVYYLNNYNIGTATAVIKGTGDYVGEVRLDFEITIGSLSDDCVFECEVDEDLGLYDLSTLKVYDKVRDRYLVEGEDYFFDDCSMHYYYPYNASYIRVFKEITGYYNYYGKISKVFPSRIAGIEPGVPRIGGISVEVIFNNGGVVPSVGTGYDMFDPAVSPKIIPGSPDDILPDPTPIEPEEPEDDEEDDTPSGHTENWIDNDDLFPPYKQEDPIGYPAGTIIKLRGVKYYSSFDNPYAEPGTLTGTFYVYSTLQFNNRIRVTGINLNVLKPGRVVGWIDVSDISFLPSEDDIFYVGDRVYILDIIYKDAYTIGSYLDKYGQYMYIVQALPEYDYDESGMICLGLSDKKNGTPIGYASRTMLVHDYNVVEKAKEAS